MAFSACGWAAEATAPAPIVTVTLDAPGAPAPAAKPSDARLARVSGWITERAPGCPPEVAIAAAQRFLEELEERHPEQLDRLLAADFPIREVESPLLRQVAAQLAGPKWASLREELARRRIETVRGTGEPGGPDAASLMARIKETSAVQHRRLLEGRLEDDDLALVLRKARQKGSAPAGRAPAAPKVLTAAEIVSEFARHNLDGSALERLQAYVVEGRLRTATGEEQHLLLFKMRPDRFRLVVLVDGATRFIMGGDGRRFWQQQPGQPPQAVAPEVIGLRRYLGEFVDPLLVAEDNHYELLGGGAAGPQKPYRIAVRRADGSGYVAQIDQATFREIGREEADGASARYSDFREIAGVTFAFREEAVDREGRTGVLELTRITPNPGLVQELFRPPAPDDQSYFAFERLLAKTSPAAGEVKTR